jgi:hypothetical protein
MKPVAVRWGILGTAIIVFVVSMPSLLEKISPRLSNYLHPGPLTTISAHIIADIEADEKGGESVMADNMKSDGSVTINTEDEALAAFVKLRNAELATRQSNEDLKVRLGQFKLSWGSEQSQRAAPVDCQAAMQDMVARFSTLADADGERLDTLQSFKPEAATHAEMAKILRRHAELDWEAVHAIDPAAVSPLVSDQWRNNATTSQAARELVDRTERACEGYWR